MDRIVASVTFKPRDVLPVPSSSRCSHCRFFSAASLCAVAVARSEKERLPTLASIYVSSWPPEREDTLGMLTLGA